MRRGGIRETQHGDVDDAICLEILSQRAPHALAILDREEVSVRRDLARQRYRVRADSGSDLDDRLSRAKQWRHACQRGFEIIAIPADGIALVVFPREILE